jgi:hypothetical protein
VPRKLPQVLGADLDLDVLYLLAPFFIPAAALPRRSRINALGASNYEDWAYFWLDVTMSKTPLRHTIIKSIL